MDVKVVRSFYFLSVGIIQYRKNFFHYCVIGTSLPPIPPLKKRNINSTKFKKKIESYQSGVEKFLDKPNVFQVKTGLTEYRVSLRKWKEGEGGPSWDYAKVVKYEILGSEVKIGIKSPRKIGKRVTGPGTYYYYKSNLYLADKPSSVKNFVDGPPISSTSQSKKRERIPDDVQIFVWNRDNAQCVKCGSNENLAFDHIIPHSLGGSNSKRNLQLLCDTCNQKKGNKIGG